MPEDRSLELLMAGVTHLVLANTDIARFICYFYEEATLQVQTRSLGVPRAIGARLAILTIMAILILSHSETEHRPAP